MKKKTLARTALIVCSVVMLGMATTWHAQRVGKEHAALELERIGLIWPNPLTSLPDEDRAILAGLAWTCGLRRRPLERDVVIGCLREALDDDDVMLPKGVTCDQARARFVALLTSASAA